MTLSGIRLANLIAGFHFFDPGAMRFFRSKCENKIYEGEGGTFFLTSEQFVPSEGPAEPRKWTVRQFNPDTGDVDTAGPFNELSKPDALNAAQHAALFGTEKAFID